jgi:hypothetical protein
MSSPEPHLAARWVLPALVTRVVLACIVLSSIALLPRMFDVEMWAASVPGADVEALGPADMLSTWDGALYLQLAERGYTAGEKTAAFYPLWPTLVRIAAPLCGGSHLAASLLLANLLAILATVLMFDLARRKVGTEAADLSVLLLLAWPGAFFLALPYSEPLFVVLALLFLRGLTTGSYRVAGPAAFAMALARPPGVFAVLPFAVDAFLRHRRGEPMGRRALWIAAPVLGWMTWLLWMQLATGDWAAGLEAQKLFAVQSSVGSLVDLPGLVVSFFDVDYLHAYRNGFLDRAMFAWFLVCLPALWKLDRVWFFYALSLGLVPALAAHFTSYVRYSMALLPLFVVTATFLASEERRPWRLPVLLGLAGLQILLAVRHINFIWAG